MCVTIIDQNRVDGQKDLGLTLAEYPISIVLAILTVIPLVFVGIMLVFHTFLIFKNITTK
jgi:hypothetical protein